MTVSSIGQAPLDFDDLEFRRGYDGYTAYARSKLAQVISSFGLGERDVTPNALHPATLMDTRMVREHLGGARSSVEEGAEATLRLIADPELDGVSGRYFDGLREARANRQAYEPDVRRRLWQLSEELTGVRVPL